MATRGIALLIGFVFILNRLFAMVLTLSTTSERGACVIYFERRQKGALEVDASVRDEKRRALLKSELNFFLFQIFCNMTSLPYQDQSIQIELLYSSLWNYPSK